MSSKKSTNDGASSAKRSRITSSVEPNNDFNGNDDKLFEPTLDMMVNDYDDESTLELEEQMASNSNEAEDPNAELNNLQRESDMPIDELLALYNCVTSPAHTTYFSGSGALRRRSKTSRSLVSERTDPPKIKILMKESNEKSTNQSKLNEAVEMVETVKLENLELNTKSRKELIGALDPSNTTKTIVESSTKDTSDKRSIIEIDINKNDENSTCKPGENDENDDISMKIHKSLESQVKKINTVKCVNPEFKKKKDTSEEMEDEEDEVDEEDESELKKLYPETYKTSEPRLLRANSQPNSDEEEEDFDYTPEEDEFKKKIMVGSEYQAYIPEGLCRYDDALPYENEDKLVWDPSQLEECDIELYLQKANIPVIVGSPKKTNSPPPQQQLPSSSQISVGSNQKVCFLPNGNHLRDDEQSLYLLLQCGHNTEEALRRRRLNVTLTPIVAVAVAATASNQLPGNDTRLSLWSEEECRNFESGLRVYGKDFHAIQQSKVRTRSVSELVQFYYLWKKTERHDIFANKARLEKKKYNLHPGLTDYMDRFLEEQENNGGININNTSNNSMIQTQSVLHGSANGSERTTRDRSASPVINCLLYTDSKRQRRPQDTSTD